MVLDNSLDNLQDEKPSINARNAAQNIAGKKRSGVQDISDVGEDDDVPGKRIRAAPDVSEGLSKESKEEPALAQDDKSSVEVTSSKGDVDSGPVQQLVAMFGALVAQGEKAVGSLEILISSISADLLTEVVMANMRNLPPNRPKVQGEEDLLQDMGALGSGTQVKHSLTLLADVFSSSGAFPQIAALLTPQQSVSNDVVVGYFFYSFPFLFLLLLWF